MNEYTCFLDMDGVLVNFVGGLCKALGMKTYSYYEYSFTKNYFDFWKEIDGVTDKIYRETISRKEFWSNLKWMHDGNDIYELIVEKFGFENVFLLTGIDIDDVDVEQAVAGKMEWIKNGPTELIDHVIFAKCSKGCISGPNKILIDDKEKNVVDWMMDGPNFLVPRPWNSGYKNCGSSVDKLKEFLNSIN